MRGFGRNPVHGPGSGRTPCAWPLCCGPAQVERPVHGPDWSRQDSGVMHDLYAAATAESEFDTCDMMSVKMKGYKACFWASALVGPL